MGDNSKNNRVVLFDNTKRVWQSRVMAVFTSFLLIPALIYGFVSVWSICFATALAYFYRQRLLKIIYTYLHFEDPSLEEQTLQTKRKIAWYIRYNILFLIFEVSVFVILPFLFLQSILREAGVSLLDINDKTFDASLRFYQLISAIDFLDKEAVLTLKNQAFLGVYSALALFFALSLTYMYKQNWEVSNRNMFVFTAKPFRYRSYAIAGAGVCVAFFIMFTSLFHNLLSAPTLGVWFVSVLVFYLLILIYSVFATFPICGDRRIGLMKDSNFILTGEIENDRK